MINSLKQTILSGLLGETLHLKPGMKNAESNAEKAIHDFVHSKDKRFKGDSKKQRIKRALGAAYGVARGENANPKVGDKMIYEGKQVVVQSINEITGMTIVKLPKFRDPKIVRACDLSVPQQLTEGILGIAAIAPTYREETTSKFMKFDLDPEDIGLLWEDTQEEPDDNGSNVRHDGHTGRTEVDELPTPSDTISPAYSDEKPPKEMGTPLSIEPGYTVATDPDFDGYDYPADAPDIPRPDFEGDENGNPRSPHWSGDHNAGEGLENRERDDSERTDENRRRRNAFSFVNEDGGMADRYTDFTSRTGTGTPVPGTPVPGTPVPGSTGIPPAPMSGSSSVPMTPMPGSTGIPPAPMSGSSSVPMTPMPGSTGIPPAPMSGSSSGNQNLVSGGAIPNAVSSATSSPPTTSTLPQVPQSGPNLESRAIASYRKLLAEMGDMLNGDEHEPKSSDTITVTLPAMASIVCTVAHKMQGDQNLMKSMIEALAEVGHGKTIDTPDLEAVASHMNGEETQEIENREDGHPEHQGIEISSGNGGIEVSMPSDKWPGDGEKSGTGKTKLMGGLGESEEEEVEECDDEMKECDDEEMAESDDNFYGWDDIVAETYKPTYEEELRMIKRRAGLKFW